MEFYHFHFKINDLLSPATFASNVYIEGQGWFIFGGTNTLETSQKLVGINSEWEVGPPAISRNIWNQCAVKVNYYRHFVCLNN